MKKREVIVSLKSDEIISQLQHANRNNVEFEARLIKSFDKNLVLAGIIAVAALIAIFFFDVTITSSMGFVVLLIPIFFVLLITLEISHNMSVTAMKSEQLVRLNAALLELQIEIAKNK